MAFYVDETSVFMESARVDCHIDDHARRLSVGKILLLVQTLCLDPIKALWKLEIERMSEGGIH